MHEPIAWKKKYYECFASLPENVKVLPCGLVVSANELLTPNQFGFRPKLSTITGVAHFTDNIPQSLDKGLFTGAVFLKLSKDFDRVDHVLLVEKLKTIGSSSQVVIFLTSYLESWY